jgi:hypothetical protein
MVYSKEEKVEDIHIRSMYDTCWIKLNSKEKKELKESKRMFKTSLEYLQTSENMSRKPVKYIKQNEWFKLYSKVKNDLGLEPDEINKLELKIPDKSDPIIVDIWNHIKKYLRENIEYINYDKFIQQYHLVLDDMFAKIEKTRFKENELIFVPYIYLSKSNTWMFFLAIKYAEEYNKKVYNILINKCVLIKINPWEYESTKLFISKSKFERVFILIVDDAVYSGQQTESLYHSIPLCIPKLKVFIAIPYMLNIALKASKNLIDMDTKSIRILNQVIPKNMCLYDFYTKHELIYINKHLTENGEKTKIRDIFYSILLGDNFNGYFKSYFKSLTVFQHKVADSLSLSSWITQSYNSLILTKGIVKIYRLRQITFTNKVIENIMFKSVTYLTEDEYIKAIEYLRKLDISNFKVILSYDIKKGKILSLPSVLPKQISSKTLGHYTELINKNLDIINKNMVNNKNTYLNT